VDSNFATVVVSYNIMSNEPADHAESQNNWKQ